MSFSLQEVSYHASISDKVHHTFKKPFFPLHIYSKVYEQQKEFCNFTTSSDSPGFVRKKKQRNLIQVKNLNTCQKEPQRIFKSNVWKRNSDYKCD